MTKTYCDRCGEEPKGSFYCYVKGTLKDLLNGSDQVDFELCKKCFKSLKQWLKKGE